MGYGTRNNGQIRTFWPDDSENEFYVPFGEDLASIMNRAQAKWGDDVRLDAIMITPEYIHTDCLTYDLYDAGDWTHFLRIALHK